MNGMRTCSCTSPRLRVVAFTSRHARIKFTMAPADECASCGGAAIGAVGVRRAALQAFTDAARIDGAEDF